MHFKPSKYDIFPCSTPSKESAAPPAERHLPFGSAVKPANSAAERCDASSSPPAAPSFSTPSCRGDDKTLLRYELCVNPPGERKWLRMSLTSVRLGAQGSNGQLFLSARKTSPVCSHSPEKGHEEEERKQQSSTVSRDNHTIEGEVTPRCARQLVG